MFKALKIFSESARFALRHPLTIVYLIGVNAIVMGLYYLGVCMGTDYSDFHPVTLISGPLSSERCFFLYQMVFAIVFHFLFFILTCYIQGLLRHKKASLVHATLSAASLVVKAPWLVALWAIFGFSGALFLPMGGLVIFFFDIIIRAFNGQVSLDLFSALDYIPCLVGLAWLLTCYAPQLVIDKHYGIANNLKYSIKYLKKSFMHLVIVFILAAISMFAFTAGLRWILQSLIMTQFYSDNASRINMGIDLIFSGAFLWLMATLRIAFNKVYLDAKKR